MVLRLTQASATDFCSILVTIVNDKCIKVKRYIISCSTKNLSKKSSTRMKEFVCNFFIYNLNLQ